MLIYGKNVALEYLENNKEIYKITLLDNFTDSKVLSAIEKRNIRVEKLNKFNFDKLVKGHHQGIILSVPGYSYVSVDDLIKEKESPCILVLDHLEDPHNLGAIIRTVEAAQIDGIIIPKDRSVSVNDTVIKVSTGAADNVKIAMVTNITETLKVLKKEGFWVTGTFMDGTNYTNIDFKGKTVIVIGNEGSGISNRVEKECDFRAAIPMMGKTNSLNASVATGIIIYEVLRQRRG